VAIGKIKEFNNFSLIALWYCRVFPYSS